MMETRFYVPDSPLRSPAALIKQMWADLLDSRELAWRLFIRDVTAQYRITYLGWFWAFVPVLSMAWGCNLAATSKVLNVNGIGIPYVAYVVLNVALWQTFAESLTGQQQAVQGAAGAISRISFPREALVLARLAAVFLNLILKAGLVAIVFAFAHVHIAPTAVFAPLLVLSLILFGTLLSLLLLPLTMIFEDANKLLNIAIGAWFLLTPVIYAQPSSGTFAWLVAFNPVTPYLVAIRELITTGLPTNSLPVVLLSFLTMAGMLAAWVLLRLSLPIVIERKGS